MIADTSVHVLTVLNIHNFYVPAGGDVADRDVNPKFGHKIDFVDEMKEWFSNNSPRKSVLVGDLNIAPLAEDVWSTRQLRNVVSHTDIEREKLTAVINEGGWVDAVREYYGPKKYYIVGGLTARETGRHQTEGDALIIFG